MTKQGVKGKCQRTLNEKYKMYYSLHANEENNTNSHTIKSTNYNKVQVIYYNLELGVTIVVYCNPLDT
jgi:hypothetical protein